MAKDTWVTITDPDNPAGSPAYDGPASDAHKTLSPGTYKATDDNGNPVTVRVTSSESHI